jgi:hypothetical protein
LNVARKMIGKDMSPHGNTKIMTQILTQKYAARLLKNTCAFVGKHIVTNKAFMYIDKNVK